MSASRTVLITEAWLAGVAADEPRSKPAKLPEGVAQLEYRDTRQIGFGVTVGRRFATFFVQRRVDGRRKMVTIGRYGQPGAGADHGERWTVARARAEAERLVGTMAHGIDPRPAPDLASTATLKDAFDAHLESLRKRASRRRPASASSTSTC